MADHHHPAIKNITFTPTGDTAKALEEIRANQHVHIFRGGKCWCLAIEQREAQADQQPSIADGAVV